MRLGALLSVLILGVCEAAARSSWKIDHSVTGLPTADGSQLTSYAGLVTVRKDNHTESGLFYWLFEAEEPKEEHPPLLLWVQGGPGSSSGIGLFYEFGPYTLDDDLRLVKNPWSWTKHYDVLFIDNPVGTGYSYVYPPAKVELSSLEKRMFEYTSVDDETDKFVLHSQTEPEITFSSDMEEDPDYERGYVTNQNGVSRDMMGFLHQFYEQFPEKRNSDLYLTSESYGGKYVPSIATAILNDNEAHANPIPLKGIAIGNQWTDPNTQILTHGAQAFYLGLVDDQQAQHLLSLAHQALLRNIQGDSVGALEKRLEMFDMYNEYTGKVNWYDVRRLNQPYSRRKMNAFFKNETIKSLLHVPSHITFTHRPTQVFYFLKADIMRSTAHLFPRLLSNLKVMLYQGQFDFRDGVASQSTWLSLLPWEGMPAFKAAKRKVWYDQQGLIAGYVTQSTNLTRVVLSNAGHMSPGDVPENAFDMMSNFVDGTDFNTKTGD